MDDQNRTHDSLEAADKQAQARSSASLASAFQEEPEWPVRSRRRGSCLGRIVASLFLLLLGGAIGLSAIIWYGLSGEGKLVLVPQSAQGNVTVEVNAAFVSQLVQQDVAGAGLPGEVKNVQVELEHGAELIISGDDVMTVLGVPLSRHFTVHMQPYVQSCTLQVRVISADLGGIPVTTFVQSFQGSINGQLAQKPTGLSNSFTYCTVGVRTEPGGLFITYQVTPITTATPAQ